MDPWCIEHHGASGLTQAVKDSKVSEAMAEQQVLDFVSKYVNKGMLMLSSIVCRCGFWDCMVTLFNSRLTAMFPCELLCA